MKIEDRVKAQVKAERSKAQQEHAKSVKASSSSLNAYEKASKKLVQAVVANDTEAKRVVAWDAYKELGKALAAYNRAVANAQDAAAKVDLLADEKELARRVKAAQKIAKGHSEVGDAPLSGAAAAEVVLLAEGKPMHYTEITRIALETGVLKLNGKTPEATMNAYLAKAVKAGDTFVRVDAGVFDLKARAKAA